jgi:hypothetical protein
MSLFVRETPKDLSTKLLDIQIIYVKKSRYITMVNPQETKKEF